jgi:flagellar protein FlgJ
MLVTQGPAAAETGTQGVEMVAQAEKLEALLWQQVLSCMTKTAFSGASLGTGSQLYNGMITRALSDKMFATTSATLTKQIVEQLGGEATQDAASGAATATPTLQALAAHPAMLSAHPAPAGHLDRAIDFAKSVWPAIKSSAAELGVPPVALLAQSALETGWGASTPGNNLFGIKAVHGQSGTLASTKEERDGVMTATQATFADYDSGAHCASAYTGLIRRVYPDAVGTTSVAQYADALMHGGYATDSSYARKIVDTAQSPTMQSVLNVLEGDDT